MHTVEKQIEKYSNCAQDYFKRKSPTLMFKGGQREPKGSQRLAKIVPRSDLEGLWKQGCFGNTSLEHLSNSMFDVLAPLGGFLVPLWSLLDFEGVPKSHFFAKDQHKMKNSKVQESVPKEHDF